MPSTSAKQAKFMRAIAHSPSFAKKVGVKQSVGKDFEMADKKMKKYATGGSTPQYPIRIDLDKAKRDTAARDAKAAQNKRTPREEAEKKAMEKKYPFNTYARGGKINPTKNEAGGVDKDMPTAKEMGDLNMAKGGGIERKGKTSTKMVKMAKGGSIDGIAQRGKTRCAGAHKGMK